MKKIMCICLSFIIVFSFNTQAWTEKTNKVLYNENDIIITLFEESDTYQKIKIEDKNKKKVEYLESYLQKDGDYIYKAISENDIYTIKKNQNKSKISITNKYNQVIQEIPINNDISEEIKTLDIENGFMQPNSLSYCVPNSNWKATHEKGYTSKSVVVGDLSFVIGVIALFSGVPPAASLVISTAIWFYSRNLKNVYYYYEKQSRKRNGWLQFRTYTRVYEDSSYSSNEIVNSMYSKANNYRYIGSPCK